MPVTTSPFRSLCYNLVRVHRHHGWIGPLVVFLLWKSAWCVLEPWKLVLSEEASKSVQVRGLWTLALKNMVFSITTTYLLLFWGNHGQQQESIRFVSLLETTDQQFKGRVSQCLQVFLSICKSMSIRILAYCFLFLFSHVFVWSYSDAGWLCRGNSEVLLSSFCCSLICYLFVYLFIRV